MTGTETYTDAQATDEAVLLLVRKLRRLYPEAHADLMGRLPEAVRDALTLADNRADLLRATDQRDGIERRMLSIAEQTDLELDGDVA